MKYLNFRLMFVTLAAAVLTACGGGGSSPSTSALPSTGTGTNTGTNTGNAGTQSTITHGFKVTFTITKTTPRPANAKPAATKSKSLLAKRKAAAAAARKPLYLAEETEGFRVIETAGTASTTYNMTFNSSISCVQQSGSIENTQTCTMTIPTAYSTTETIQLYQVDQPPNGATDPNTGIAAAGVDFPSNSAVLGVGSGTATPIAGGITNVTISMNPIIGNWYDCGFDTDSNIDQDISTSGQVSSAWTSYAPNYRIVMTGNAPAYGTFLDFVYDYDGGEPTVVYPNGTPVGQPYADVNGTATPVTMSLSSATPSTNIKFLPVQSGLLGYVDCCSPLTNPPTNGNYGAVGSLPDTSWVTQYAEAWTYFRYDGFGTQPASAAAAAPGFIVTLANNLTATPPVFAGPSVTRSSYCCGYPIDPATNPSTTSYAAQMNWLVAPVWATISSATVANNGTATVYGFDAGATSNMDANNCVDAYNNTLGTFSNASTMSPAGVETFTFTAAATGTCTFTLQDDDTGIYSNPVLVTIQ